MLWSCLIAGFYIGSGPEISILYATQRVCLNVLLAGFYDLFKFYWIVGFHAVIKELQPQAFAGQIHSDILPRGLELGERLVGQIDFQELV